MKQKRCVWSFWSRKLPTKLLYFFFLNAGPHLRWRGLAIGIAAGVVFGIAQQLRGAHFLSHDLWTAAICWTTAVGLYLWLRPKANVGFRTR